MNNLDLAKQIINSLIEERDFLCWQLTNANGGLNKEQFEEITKDYLNRRITNKSQEQLNLEAEMLYSLILEKEKLDSELTSLLLKCSFDEAVKALIYVANILEKNDKNRS